ncbi:MAG TPA: c-type cytochrome domain-containing protein, partial [Planctomycetia bacterium]|nr:c-type cytochrome domain-containing protein [Planctomycetia bacterium]
MLHVTLAFALAAGADPKVTFAEIAPVFVDSCLSCHDAKSRKGKYDMSTPAALLRPGKNGVAIVPGKPNDSRLYRMIAGHEEPAMPKNADPLDEQTVDKVKRWIAAGASFDGTGLDRDLRTMVAPAPVPDSTPNPGLARAPVAALAFSPDGKELAVGGAGEVLFWNPEKGTLIRRQPVGLPRIHALAFDKSGGRLLLAGGSPGRSGRAVLWDLKKGAAAREFPVQPDVVLAAALSPDETLLATGGTDRTLRVYEVATGKEIAKAENHGDWVQGIAWHPDGVRILTAGRDKAVKVWDRKADEVTLAFPRHEDAVAAVAVAKDGKRAFSLGVDRTLRVWETDGEGKQTRSEFAHQDG